jgi:hypothetical protein|tara:strand:+ start:488 stop:1024 length:537 start_codon:yes stop_codon:yes gene_type:complete
MATINKSILNKNNFRLLIDKVPTVEYYVQTVNIPSLSFVEVNMPTRVGVDAFFPGDKVEFGNLTITFIVDEDLENFKEIYDWMSAIVPISDSADFAKISGTTKASYDQLGAINDDLAQYSQITLVTNTNKNIPNKYFRFYDCFPTSLGSLELQSGAEAEPVTCSVDFRFTYYTIESTS